MSNEGTGGAFVNSHGYVHDMVTLHRATNATCEGEPETEHSWFPGYAWTIAYCAGCTNHLVSRICCAVSKPSSGRVYSYYLRLCALWPGGD